LSSKIPKTFQICQKIWMIVVTYKFNNNFIFYLISFFFWTQSRQPISIRIMDYGVYDGNVVTVGKLTWMCGKVFATTKPGGHPSGNYYQRKLLTLRHIACLIEANEPSHSIILRLLFQRFNFFSFIIYNIVKRI